MLASSRSRLARRPWASPAADPAGPSCRPPCSACPFDAWGLSRPPGGQAAVLQAERACPAVWAPRHATTARPDPQGVCAVKGQPARWHFPECGTFRPRFATRPALRLWGLAPVAPRPFLGLCPPRAEACSLAKGVWRSFGHRPSSSQVSLGRIFFLMQVAGHGIMPTARRNESVADGIREACGSAQTMQGMVRADCRLCRHSQCETSAKAPARLAQGPSGAVRLAQIVWRRLPGADCLAERRSGGAALPGRASEQGVKETWAA